MRAKPWYHSRTIWLNAAAGGVAFMACGWQAFADTLPLPKWLVFLFGGVVAAANVGLRFITTDPITVKKIQE